MEKGDHDMEQLLRILENLARDGYRMRIQTGGKDTNLWAGLGNRSGLHGFASTLLLGKWDKSGERMLKKASKLAPGTQIVVYDFRNVNRDRGNWAKVKTLTVPKP